MSRYEGDQAEFERLWLNAEMEAREVAGWALEEIEKVETVCRRDEFLDDPMTVDSGMGSEMVGLVRCDCSACKEER